VVVRLYRDENVDRLLIVLLRATGFDVVFSRDVFPSGTSDHLHLLSAAQTQRILVTHDKEDFRLLYFAWHDWFAAFAVLPRPRHAGILRLPQSPGLATRQAAQLLQMLLDGAPEDVVANRLLEWSPMQGWEEVIPGARRPFATSAAGDPSARIEPPL
jgi:hypothetical protein